MLNVQVIGEHESSLRQALEEFGVHLKPSSYGQDVKPLLKEACSAIFGTATGLVDMMIQHFPSSKEASTRKVSSFWPNRYSRPYGHLQQIWLPLLLSISSFLRAEPAAVRGTLTELF